MKRKSIEEIIKLAEMEFPGCPVLLRNFLRFVGLSVSIFMWISIILVIYSFFTI
jgi:hypothetical protein